MNCSRKKVQVTYKGETTSITAHFSVKTLKARRAWNSALQVLKGHKSQSWLIVTVWRKMHPCRLIESDSNRQYGCVGGSVSIMGRLWVLRWSLTCLSLDRSSVIVTSWCLQIQMYISLLHLQHSVRLHAEVLSAMMIMD